MASVHSVEATLAVAFPGPAVEKPVFFSGNFPEWCHYFPRFSPIFLGIFHMRLVATVVQARGTCRVIQFPGKLRLCHL